MEDVDLRHAKEHLEELIERAPRGEDVRIADSKGGAVRLTPVASETIATLGKWTPGRWKDRLPAAPDGFFDPMSEEELRDWYGDDP